MQISAIKPGWAEQDPDMWWYHVQHVTHDILAALEENSPEIAAIGISYQMHGLVLVDSDLRPTRPSIIWCDSRAVAIGDKAFTELGEKRCLKHLLNSPGNFTASKLKWVIDNEPDVYKKSRYFMLPGDYIALRLTGQPSTTAGGLSEGVLWDFEKHEPAGFVMDYMGIDRHKLPDILPNFSESLKLGDEAAKALGLRAGVPVTYRSGDQPNNALSLGAFKTGDIAGTGGTSGVIYAVTAKPVADRDGRVNTFAHVNYTRQQPNMGVLLCINGAGIQYAWTRANSAGAADYTSMENLASKVPVGSQQLVTLPFGNGAERMLKNRDTGGHVMNLSFNLHSQAHLYRSALEGIAFAFVYGMDILRELGIPLERIRVGNDNLFQSRIFSQTIASLSGTPIELIDATGSTGAALAAGFGAGITASLDEFSSQLQITDLIQPVSDNSEYLEAYHRWRSCLDRLLEV